MYKDGLLERFKNTSGAGTLDKEQKNVGTGMVGAPACGDVMKLQIQVSDQGIIEKAVFKTFGCGAAIASSQYVTEVLQGKSLGEAKKIKNSQIVEKLSLPPVKIHCSVLAEEAIQAAIKDYNKKNDLVNEENSI